VPPPLQYPKGLQTAATLPETAGIHEAHFITQAVGQLGAVHVGALGKVLTHPLDAIRLG
jgi:hypothetical protein